MLDNSDEEIASRVQKGDKESFGVLVERYEQKMLRYAKRFLLGREDAEDLVQNVFIKAYINIQGFDTKRKFSSWIYRIAHNEFINAIKERSKIASFLADFDTIFPYLSDRKKADDELLKKDIRRMIDECLDKLDIRYREPLLLYYFEEMSYQEISDVMRIPTSTVGVRLKRGKKLLSKFYNQLDKDYGQKG